MSSREDFFNCSHQLRNCWSLSGVAGKHTLDDGHCVQQKTFEKEEASQRHHSRANPKYLSTHPNQANKALREVHWLRKGDFVEDAQKRALHKPIIGLNGNNEKQKKKRRCWGYSFQSSFQQLRQTQLQNELQILSRGIKLCLERRKAKCHGV